MPRALYTCFSENYCFIRTTVYSLSQLSIAFNVMHQLELREIILKIKILSMLGKFWVALFEWLSISVKFLTP